MAMQKQQEDTSATRAEEAQTTVASNDAVSNSNSHSNSSHNQEQQESKSFHLLLEGKPGGMFFM